MKKIAFWIITISIPIAVLLLLELGLRIGGYNGQAKDLFIEFPGQPNHLVTNPDFVDRYFPSFSPKFDVSPFRKTKTDSTFRVFVLGGSSAEGFPYSPYISFSERIKQKLLLETQGLDIEVINLGMTAVNSYVIRDLSRRLPNYHPDAVVIYAGHNEYYGSFGVASTQFSLVNNMYIKRLILRLKDVAVYQLLDDLITANTRRPRNRTMMAEVIKKSDINYQSDLFEAGIQQFESNISDVLQRFRDNDIPVYIGTIASNLKDQPPLGDEQAALEAFSKANQFFRNGQIDSAKQAFLRAKELDGTRFRAPLAMNKTIRQLAKTYDATVVDIYEASFDSSTSGIPDSSFFDDHLHPNWQGHQMMGELFFEKLQSQPVIVNHYMPNALSRRLPINRFEESYADLSIAKLTSGFPFNKGVSDREQEQAFQEKYNRYLERSYIDSLAAVTWKHRRPVPLALDNVVTHLLESDSQQTEALARHYQSLVQWPIISIKRLKQGVDMLMKSSRKLDIYSAPLLHYSINERSRHPYFLNAITALYLMNKDANRGKYWLQILEQAAPGSPDVYHNYARYFAVKGDVQKANRYYRKYLESRSSK